MKKFKLVSSLGIMACSLAFLLGNTTDATAKPALSTKCSMCHTAENVGKAGSPKALVLEDSDTNKNLKNATNTLSSLVIKATEAPALDGKADTIWSKAKPLAVKTVQLLPTGFNPTVTVKSLHTDKKIYVLATWADATADLNKDMWTFNGTAWSKSGNEDRLSFQWDNDIPGFNKVGCAITCHGVDGKKAAPTSKTADLWHWKSTRNLPYKNLDDTKVTEAGRGNDTGLAIVTKNEVKDAAGIAKPKFMIDSSVKSVVQLPFVTNSLLFASNAKLFDPLAFTSGATIPGYVINDVTNNTLGLTAGPDQSFDDVKATAFYDKIKKVWTLEIERDLNTGNADDVAFEISKVKAFGLSVFNNSSDEDHAVSNGPLYLEFVKAPAVVQVNKALVLTKTLKVYTKAATNSKVLVTLKKGQKVAIVKSSGKWLTVKTSKGNGYILRTSTNVKITK